MSRVCKLKYTGIYHLQSSFDILVNEAVKDIFLVYLKYKWASGCSIISWLYYVCTFSTYQVMSDSGALNCSPFGNK